MHPVALCIAVRTSCAVHDHCRCLHCSKSSQSVLSLLLLQAKELQAAQKAVDESAAQAASAQQLLSGVQADKASLAQQVKKLTAEKASLLEQLGSSAGDIDMLQVR